MLIKNQLITRCFLASPKERERERERDSGDRERTETEKVKNIQDVFEKVDAF